MFDKGDLIIGIVRNVECEVEEEVDVVVDGIDEGVLFGDGVMLDGEMVVFVAEDDVEGVLGGE